MRGNAGPRRGNPRQHAGVGILDAQAIGDKGIVLGVAQGRSVGEVKWPIDQFLQRPPIHPGEGRIAVNVRDIGIVGVNQEKILSRSPGAMVQTNVEVEH